MKRLRRVFFLLNTHLPMVCSRSHTGHMRYSHHPQHGSNGLAHNPMTIYTGELDRHPAMTTGTSRRWRDIQCTVLLLYRYLILAPVDVRSASALLYKHPLMTCQKLAKHTNDTRNLQIKAMFSYRVIHAQEIRWQSGARSCIIPGCLGCPRI